ncbi:MAG: hypothetical protein HYZ45_09505, partial [Burkholderiales bacterium]|nr:hypothetical protein [Burkholderiales bacterium]
MQSTVVSGKVNDAMQSPSSSYFAKLALHALALSLLLALGLAARTSHAANLQVGVQDTNGVALADAVVYAIPE